MAQSILTSLSGGSEQQLPGFGKPVSKSSWYLSELITGERRYYYGGYEISILNTEKKSVKELQDQLLLCIFCKGLLRNPRQMPCGHRSCTSCVEHYFLLKQKGLPENINTVYPYCSSCEDDISELCKRFKIEECRPGYALGALKSYKRLNIEECRSDYALDALDSYKRINIEECRPDYALDARESKNIPVTRCPVLMHGNRKCTARVETLFELNRHVKDFHGNIEEKKRLWQHYLEKRCVVKHLSREVLESILNRLILKERAGVMATCKEFRDVCNTSRILACHVVNSCSRAGSSLFPTNNSRLVEKLNNKIGFYFSEVQNTEQVNAQQLLAQHLHIFPTKNTYILKGHKDKVKALVCLSDNKVVSLSNDSTLRLWDLSQPEGDMCIDIQQLKSDELYTYHLIALSDDQVVFVSEYNLKVFNFNLPNTDRCTHILRGHKKYIRGVAVSSDSSQLLASASWDKTMRVWDLTRAGDRCALILKKDQLEFEGVAFLSKEQLISSYISCCQLHVWDIANLHEGADEGRCIRCIDVSGPISGILVLPNNCLVTSSMLCGDINLVDLKKSDEHACTHTFKHLKREGTMYEGVERVIPLIGGRFIVSVAKDGTLKVWDLRKRKYEDGMQAHWNWVTDVSLSSGGQLVTSSDDGTLKVWDY